MSTIKCKYVLFRKPHRKHGAALGMVFGRDGSPLAGDDGFAEGQADAVAGGAAARSAVKAVKEKAQLFLFKARAVVADGNFRI